MKKIIYALFASLIAIAPVSAEIGVNIGVSGQAGLYAASGTETDTGTHGTTSGADEKRSDSGFGEFGFASFFIEKTIGDRLFIGYDYSPTGHDVAAADQTRETRSNGNGAMTTVTNKVKVGFEDLYSLYVGLNITENAYFKIGTVEMDVITKENLGTGSTYGNTSVDGTTMSVGYNKDFDNGMFARLEGTYMEFGGTSLTSSSGSQKIAIDNLDGVTGKISVGKSF